MHFRFLSLVIFLFSVNTIGQISDPQNSEFCKKESASDQFLFSDDFKWDYSLQEMILKFKEMYSSLKRLKNRAYLDSNSKIYFPYSSSSGGNIKVPQLLVNSISSHIEQGLADKIVDGVFFPDMGHSHFFIPQAKYDAIYSKIEPAKFNIFYEKLFSESGLKILYHTAEQLQTRDENENLIQDPETLNRFKNRNLVGSNDGKTKITVIQNPESPANTARELDGYFYWGAGFNLSANQNGCFEFRRDGKIYRFDISMFDLEPSETAEGGF